jgi:hypothetical protein
MKDGQRGWSSLKRLKVGEVLPTCRLAKGYSLDNVQTGSESDALSGLRLMVQKYNEKISCWSKIASYSTQIPLNRLKGVQSLFRF